MQKNSVNTALTTRMTKLSFVLLTSALLVLSSIAAAQLLVTDNNVAFAAQDCDVTEETEETVEFVCSGGVGGRSVGQGGHQTCTFDISTGRNTCTTSGGGGGRVEQDCEGNPEGDCEKVNGGGGGRSICTFDPSTGEDFCSQDVGSGSRP